MLQIYIGFHVPKPFSSNASNICKLAYTYYTVRDPKVSHFFERKTLEKWDTLGTFTQKVLFLDYNKLKMEKSGTLWVINCILHM